MEMPVVNRLIGLILIAILDIVFTIWYMSWLVHVEYNINSTWMLGVIFGFKRLFDFLIIASMYEHWHKSIKSLASHFEQEEPAYANSVLRERMPMG